AAGGGGFSFRTGFSLGPLIDFWLRARDDGSPMCSAPARLFGEGIKKGPGLTGALTDPALLDRPEDPADLLLGAEFPPAPWGLPHGAAMIPLQLRGFYATPAMRRDLMYDDGRLKGRINLDDGLVAAIRRGFAYVLVLRRLYGFEIELDYPLILTVPDESTG